MQQVARYAWNHELHIKVNHSCIKMHATHEIVNYTSKLIICALFVIPHLVPPIIPNGRHSMESLTPRFELINQAIG